MHISKSSIITLFLSKLLLVSAHAQQPTETKLAAQRTTQATPATEDKTAIVTTEQFKKFEGYYQLGPGFVTRIFQKNGKFLSQANGQSPFELFADSPMSFYAKIANIKLQFELGADGNVSGFNSTQNGRSAPFSPRIVDAKALAALAQNRPQEEAIEKQSPSYQGSDVSFSNTKAQIQLAATLTIPQGTGPFPAVVLVHGSGPMDRNGETRNHKNFLVLADHLSKQGIAVLRYDKRGVAASQGDFKTATSIDFADDAESAVAYLRTRKDIDHNKIGMIGHSEGGLIAPIVAARDPKLKFVVLMGAPGIAIKSLMLEQSRLISTAAGESKKDVEENQAFLEKAYAVMTSGSDETTIKQQLTALFDQLVKEGQMPANVAKGQLANLTSPWFLHFIMFDPTQTLRKVKQPVLALNGELDLQVAAKSNLAGLKEALKQNSKVVIRELPKLNHLFQTATTGSPSEYAKIEETIAPMALEIISNWIRGQ